jgi:hypothetical protein
MLSGSADSKSGDGTPVCLPLGWRAFIAVSRREQTPACTVVSLHVGVVVLTARALNRRRSSRAFSGRDDAGPRSPNTQERKWTRPLCSSSSSWCSSSAAADSSTDVGFESDRVHSPGSFAALPYGHRSHGLSPVLTRPAIRHSFRRRNRIESSRASRRERPCHQARVAACRMNYRNAHDFRSSDRVMCRGARCRRILVRLVPREE